MRFQERRVLLETARRMADLGLAPGTSGNVSVRLDRGMLITPSGVGYDVMTREDLVEVDDDGVRRGGGMMPSTEWRLHLDLYRARAEVGGIVHTHSMFATALSCHRRGIPAFHYMIAVGGGNDIRCAEY